MPRHECGPCLVVRGDERERAGGVVEGRVLGAEIERRPVRVVQRHVDSRVACVRRADREHVGGRVDTFDIEAVGDVAEQQPAVAAPELERRARAALDGPAVEVDIAVVAVGWQPDVVRLGDQAVVRLVDGKRVADELLEIHQEETAGMTSAAKRSRPSRSNGARIARMTYDAPASTYPPTLSTISWTLPDSTPGFT